MFMKVFNCDKFNLNNNFEELNIKLQEDIFLNEYKTKYDNYPVSILPKVFAYILLHCGDFVYGKDPSLAKFRAIEVIARVPYQSWSSAAYTLLTLFYTREDKALALAESKLFARHANDNETMHVIVLSHIIKEEHKSSNIFKHIIVPMIFAFFYFWISYTLYLINRRWSYELNYLFENHAYHQYNTFINRYSLKLKQKFLNSQFLKWYGRNIDNQYDFLLSVRNDEIIHRNISIDEIKRYCQDNLT